MLFLYFSFYTSIFSYHFYKENQILYNLFEYRNHFSSSKIYYRNLIAFYFFDNKKKSELLEFLKVYEPSFYWSAKILWEEEQKGTYNPAVSVWNQFLKISTPIDYNSLKKHCEFFGEYFCQWIEDIEFLYKNYYLTKKNIEIQDLETILLKLKPYLTKNEFIPFMFRTAYWLPSFLNEIGLAVESSIICQTMMHREAKENQERLIKEFIKSLVFSGNFEYAYKVLKENQIQIEEKYFNSFNILMLSLNYDLIIKHLEQNYIKRNFFDQIDLWTNFPISKNLVKIRMMEILYAKNQNSNILIQIENLLKNKEFSEFEKQYLRFIQSKILYDTNIVLAQKIAEDVQFKSQERDFYLLEYYSTIWNGWCFYKQAQYYSASIEFTKALNIAKRHFPKFSRYSVLLGLLLTKAKFNIIDLNLIKELSISFRDYVPQKEYFYFIELVPKDISYDIWKDIYIEFLISKKNYKSLFEFIVMEYYKNFFFENSKNPGGYIGLYTVSLWKQRFQENVKKYDIIKKNYLYTNFVNKKKESIFFVKTLKQLYIFVFSKNSVVYQKYNLNSYSTTDLINFIKSYSSKNIEIVLNPEMELSIQDLLNNLDLSKIQFSLMFYQSFTKKFDPIDYSKVLQEKSDLCNLNKISQQDLILFPENYIPNEGYPFLTKFQCSENDFYSLWDLEKFLPGNKKLLLPFVLEAPEWNVLLQVAIRKNWYIEIIHSSLVCLKHFED